MSLHGGEPLGDASGEEAVSVGFSDEPVSQPNPRGGVWVAAGGKQYRIRRDGEDSYQVFRESDVGVVWCGLGRRNGEFLGDAHPEVRAVAPRLLGWA